MDSPPRPHPRTLGWLGTTALALGGSNQSLFLIGALIAGQDGIPGQGSAAIPLLILGLILSWMAVPGWLELILMWPDRVGGIASCCAEAFRPYSPVLAAVTGTSYWWGWVPTCGLTALLSASAIHHWFLPGVPIPPLACGLVLAFTCVNLMGVQWVARLMTPMAALSATLAFLSAVVPIATGHVDWHRATAFHLTLPFPGPFGAVTAAMAGLYLIGFAAPAFEAATCHVGETVDPNKNVPRAVCAAGAVATLYFVILPLVWHGSIGLEGLTGDLARTLGPTFAPLLGGAAKGAALAFMVFNMFHGTAQPLAGAARTLAQLAEDGLLPSGLGRRSSRDVPWAATWLTALMAMAFLLLGDPIWLVAAANLTYLAGIALPNVAVWLLRKDAPHRERPYRAANWAILAGVIAASVWGVSTLLGFQQFGMPTVLFGLTLVFSGALLYGSRRWEDRRRMGTIGPRRSLYSKLTGALLLVTAMDGAGYLLAIQNVGPNHTALIAMLEDIFVAVALLTFAVGLVLPGMVAHAAEQVAEAAHRLAGGTLADLSRAMQALGRGEIENAQARVDSTPVLIYSDDEMGAMAASFNRMQVEATKAAHGLDSAREGLRQARQDLLDANARLEARFAERTGDLQKSERRFRSLVQNATDIITVVDAEGMIEYLSPSVQRVLGHDPYDLVGTSLFARIHPLDAPSVREDFTRLLQDSGVSAPTRFRMRHRDGGWRVLEAIGSNLLGDSSVRGVVINARDVTERQTLEEERERLLALSEARADREALINRIGAALRDPEAPEQPLPTVLRELGQALKADRCYFAFYDQPGEAATVPMDWARIGMVPLTLNGPTVEAWTAHEEPQGTLAISDVRNSVLLPSAQERMREFGLRAALRVPLSDQGRRVALLCVAMASPREWTPEEISLVETVATQTWASVETARLHQREHAIADSLQRALLPPIPSESPGLFLAHHYQAALAEANIGGDFYDVYELEPEVTVLVIGDVSGKGLAAAAQVATVRQMLRSLLYLGLTVAEAVTQLNSLLLEHKLLVGFATLFVGVFDARTSVLTYVNCGHEVGLLRRAGSQLVEELGVGGMALGILKGERYEEARAALTPGDALVLYTDGISEAAGADKNQLGTQGLSRMIQENRGQGTALPLVQTILAGVTEHAGPRLRDDICILAAIAQPTAASPPLPAGVPDLTEDEIALFEPAEAPLPDEDAGRRIAAISRDLVSTVQEGRFVAMNPAGARLLGLPSPAAALGLPLIDVVHPHWRPLVQGLLRQVDSAQSLPAWTEQHWVRADGRELLVEMSAARALHAGQPALLILARDITDRREIQEQNARLLCEVNVAAIRQRSFLRDVLSSVTEGRLRLCEGPGDLPERRIPFGHPVSLTTPTLSDLRRLAREAARAEGLPIGRSHDLESAVGEAAMNAVSHAGGGRGQVFASHQTVQVWIQDTGKGIALETLPQATLERGYTTAGTLGHGFWIMLQTVDRVWLLTGPEGTTLVIEQDQTAPPTLWNGLEADLPPVPFGE